MDTFDSFFWVEGICNFNQNGKPIQKIEKFKTKQNLFNKQHKMKNK